MQNKVLNYIETNLPKESKELFYLVELTHEAETFYKFGITKNVDFFKQTHAYPLFSLYDYKVLVEDILTTEDAKLQKDDTRKQVRNRGYKPVHEFGGSLTQCFK